MRTDNDGDEGVAQLVQEEVVPDATLWNKILVVLVQVRKVRTRSVAGTAKKNGVSDSALGSGGV